jgi:hypothetical protein
MSFGHITAALCALIHVLVALSASIKLQIKLAGVATTKLIKLTELGLTEALWSVRDRPESASGVQQALDAIDSWRMIQTAR